MAKENKSKYKFETEKEVVKEPASKFTVKENEELDSFYNNFNTFNNRKVTSSRLTIHKYINVELGEFFITKSYSTKVRDFLLSLNENDDFLSRRK